jgi:hypothetical protein
MPLNYKALKEYEPGGGRGVSEWFRPKPGDGGADRSYTVRVLLQPDADFPFFDSQIHYFRWKDGFMSGACPRMSNEFCPACDMFFKLRLHPDYSDGKGKELLRKLSPTTRVYTNIVVRGVDRVQVWSMPFTFSQDLKNQLLVYLEDGVDLTDEKKGHDLSFTVGKKGAVQQYGSITVRPRASALDVEDWQAQCHDLEAKAHSRMFTKDDVDDLIEKVLGDEAASMIQLYLQSKEEEKEEKKSSDDDDIGEAV